MIVRFMILKGVLAVVLRCVAFLLSTIVAMAYADEVGSVDTSWKLLGPDNKIVVESFDDPSIHGITCYLSRAKTGGLSGAVGAAEDQTEASLACLKFGSITINGPLPKQEDIIKIRTSLLFKTLHLVRILDPKSEVAIYLSYSDKIINGSPKNSISVVPLGQPIALSH